ncbi:MAG: S8 family serine peptidase [Sphingomonadales bacterium]
MKQTLKIAGSVVALLLAAPSQAQILGPVGQTVDQVSGPLLRDTGLDRTVDAAARPVRDLAGTRLRGLLRENPKALEADDDGFPVVRGEVVALAPADAAIDRARGAGFQPTSRETLDGLGITLVTLRTPEGMSARRALKKLRKLDPAGSYDLNHLYTGAGAPTGPSATQPAAASGGEPRIGLIDTGVAAHPAVDGLIAEQAGFAPGGVVAGAHGTAVASLLAGRSRGFNGAAPGLTLLVADIYGNGPTGGSARALAHALAWMAQQKVSVVNVSLVGPPNMLVEAAVQALGGQGIVVVAAVGNDGPAAAPAYPAAYDGVIAVTAVDRNDKVLIEAGRSKHVDFAAPGADMVAAAAGGGYVKVRGTSYAAPLVAGKLALAAPAHGDAMPAVEALARSALDLGKKGPDPVYGRGLVCGSCRNPPP